MKDKKIEVAISDVEERTQHTCPMTDLPFFEDPGAPIFRLDKTPVHPDFAKQVGYQVSDSLVLPKDVGDRTALGLFLTERLGISRNSPEFMRVYSKYADVLPSGVTGFSQ